MSQEVDGIVEQAKSEVGGIVENTKKSYPVLAIAGVVVFVIVVIAALA